MKDLQRVARRKFEESEHGKDKYAISEEFKETPEMKNLNKKEETAKKQRELFNKCKFLLNRECPIYSL